MSAFPVGSSFQPRQFVEVDVNHFGHDDYLVLGVTLVLGAVCAIDFHAILVLLLLLLAANAGDLQSSFEVPSFSLVVLGPATHEFLGLSLELEQPFDLCRVSLVCQ